MTDNRCRRALRSNRRHAPATLALVVAERLARIRNPAEAQRSVLRVWCLPLRKVAASVKRPRQSTLLWHFSTTRVRRRMTVSRPRGPRIRPRRFLARAGFGGGTGVLVGEGPPSTVAVALWAV